MVMAADFGITRSRSLTFCQVHSLRNISWQSECRTRHPRCCLARASNRTKPGSTPRFDSPIISICDCSPKAHAEQNLNGGCEQFQSWSPRLWRPLQSPDTRDMRSRGGSTIHDISSDSLPMPRSHRLLRLSQPSRTIHRPHQPRGSPMS